MNTYWVDLFTRILFLYCLYIVGINGYSIVEDLYNPRSPIIPKELYNRGIYVSLLFITPYAVVGFFTLKSIVSKKEDSKLLVISVICLSVFSSWIYPLVVLKMLNW